MAFDHLLAGLYQYLCFRVLLILAFFEYLPGWAITIRYGGSWLLRILGISAGIGLLYGHPAARKIATGISV